MPDAHTMNDGVERERFVAANGHERWRIAAARLCISVGMDARWYSVWHDADEVAIGEFDGELYHMDLVEFNAARREEIRVMPNNLGCTRRLVLE